MIIYVIPFIDRSMSARDLTPSTKIECSLMLVDVSGFTQLLYHAGYKDELMHIVALAMKRFFQDAASAAQATKDVEIFNTTGDGFLAFATGRTPSRTALHFVEAIRSNFDGHVKSLIRSVPFRQRVDLRGRVGKPVEQQVLLAFDCGAEQFGVGDLGDAQMKPQVERTD